MIAADDLIEALVGLKKTEVALTGASPILACSASADDRAVGENHCGIRCSNRGQAGALS
jgi:hypothetical protein